MCRTFKNRMRRLRRARRLRQATQPTSQATQLSQESHPAEATRQPAQTAIRQPAQTTRQAVQTTLRPAQAIPSRQPAQTIRQPAQTTQPVQTIRRPAQATPQLTPTRQPSQPAQPSLAILRLKPGETPPAYRDVVKFVPDPDYPYLFDRAIPNALCRDAIDSIIKINNEAKASIASKASETTKKKVHGVIVTLLAEAFDVILELDTEEHWLDWVVCTFKACAADITNIAGTSADDGTIGRELENVLRNGSLVLLQRLSPPAIQRTSGSTVSQDFGSISIGRYEYD